jgi:hypothetical protein
MRAVFRYTRCSQWFILIAAMAGCLEASQTSVGTIHLNLVGQAPSGAVFRLRNAIITVTGVGMTKVWNTEDAPDQTTLSADVAPGDYSAALAAGWSLERLEANSAIPVPAELISDNPDQFTVPLGQRINVPLRFAITEGEVDMAQGYDLVIAVDEVPPRIIVGYPQALAVYPAAANGAQASLRTLAGPVTTVDFPTSVAVANGEVVVADIDNAIDFFPIGATGDRPPIRRIAGPATTLSSPSSLAIVGDELYVGQFGSIVVFPLNAAGNATPTRTISGVSGHFLAVDHGEIYVSEPGSIAVYAANATGNALPTRTIFGPACPGSLAIHAGEIFVADMCTLTVQVFPEVAMGDGLPIRELDPFGEPDDDYRVQLAIFHDELYVSDTRGIRVFPTNVLVNAPTRSFLDPAHRGTPLGLAVYGTGGR